MKSQASWTNFYSGQEDDRGRSRFTPLWPNNMSSADAQNIDPDLDYPEGPRLSPRTMTKRLKFLASDEAKPIREMVVKKHLNPDICLWNRHTMGNGAQMYINQLVKEKGWAWEELKMEGLKWNDHSRESRLVHDWHDIVEIALAWSASN